MSEDSNELDRRLASAAASGDRRAFEQLVQRHKVVLYRFVRRYVGDSDDAYDLLQDAFVSAWLALRRFDHRQSFSTWLRAIALNKCRDYGRRRAVRRRILAMFALETTSSSPVEDVEADPARDEYDRRRLRHLDEAIAALPRLYKEPLLLMIVSGLTQQQVAAQLNTSTKAVEMRIRRAKRRLTAALTSQGSAPREG